MKRGPGLEGGAPTGGPKRSRGDRLEVRLIIPSKVAGSIIGKGGANIQKLRTENNANVRVPDCPGPERVMTVHAETIGTALKVIEQSIPLLSEEAANAAPGAAPPAPGALEVRLLIHQSIVGGIIGRAGFKIKEIREQSGANIKVYQTCAPQSSDRCVAVQGSGEKIVEAIRLIFLVVESTEVKGPDQPYDPNNFDGFYAHEYGGFGSEMDVAGFGNNAAGRGGPGRQGMMARGARGGGYAGNQEFRGGYGRGGYGPGYARGGNRYPGPPADFGAQDYFVDEGGDSGGGEHESTQVTIPKDMAGAIIGPGGSRIRKIRSDSKATITIDEPLPGSTDRIITISGSQRSIQTAQYLLQQSVREHSNPANAGRY